MNFSEFLNESDLGGKSRSFGDTNWNAYVSDLTVDFTTSVDVPLTDIKGKIKKKLTKGTHIKIISKDLFKIVKSDCAKIKVDNDEGYIRISAITKPVISKNTKEFTPTRMGLGGQRLSLDELVKKIEAYIKPIPEHYKSYIEDLVDSIVNKRIFEKEERFTKDVRLQTMHKLDPKNQLNVLSKNFGEVLAALFVMKTNKKAKFVEYPKLQNEPLCDFWIIDANARKTFYSVKSKSGSSTNLKNLEKFLPYINIDKNSTECKKLFMILGNFKQKQKTIDTILNYMNMWEDEKVITKKICNILSMPDLTTKSIDDLWKRIKSGNVQVDILYDVYKILGYPIDEKTKKSLTTIFSKDEDFSSGGFLVFPLGSYIIKRLNASPKMLQLLNDILTLSAMSGSVLQINVDCYNDKVVFSLIRFSNNQNRFSYNAGMKYPANRSFGFIEV